MPKTRNHPFAISTAENKPMKCFDMMLQVGNFRTQAEAEDFARVLVKFMEDNANAWSARVQ